MLNRFSTSNALCMRNYKFKFNCIAFWINLLNKCICEIIEWTVFGICVLIWDTTDCRNNLWSARQILKLLNDLCTKRFENCIGRMHTHIVSYLTHSYSHMFDRDLHRKCTNYVFTDRGCACCHCARWSNKWADERVREKRNEKEMETATETERNLKLFTSMGKRNTSCCTGNQTK